MFTTQPSPQLELPPSKKKIFSVSELNSQIKSSLSDNFQMIWLQGEISNLTQPRSGHCYFYLKDKKTQIRCVLFNMHNRMLAFQLKNGLHILVNAKLTLYEPRGDVQLSVITIEEIGTGNLQLAFERLKHKLAKEGLFDQAHKKKLPAFAQRIGIITSPTSAAIKDIKITLHRRFPLLPFTIYPAVVQGKTSPQSIINALKNALSESTCQVLILARGGGSLEDLWTFNDEQLARNLYKCPIPIITGIGHEIDFTIADFVADIRAATPTAAAELISPCQEYWKKRLISYQDSLQQLIKKIINVHQERLGWIHKTLLHPRQKLIQDQNKLIALTDKLSTQMQQNWLIKKNQYSLLIQKINQITPEKNIIHLKTKLNNLVTNLNNVFKKNLTKKNIQIDQLCQTLDLMSPLQTLQRGYALVYQQSSEKLITKTSGTKPGDLLSVQLIDGKLNCRIESIDRHKKNTDLH